MTKRKAVENSAGYVEPASPQKKARTAIPQTTRGSFAEGLFEDHHVKAAAERYAASEPYKHAVLQPLVSDVLLRSVLDEIRTQLHFTEKTTDIYRIWQSGDLANLDGLDAAALEQLPALRQLRDALYSREFRDLLSQVTGAGPLSGSRTDMAVNIYQPGCYLLCHDDVIGTRRVSYILYLTEQWEPSWGGALRLYATETRTRPDGKGSVKVPISHHRPEHAIPPGWNQLSFFAVQPGESYHDVEEVYVPRDSTDRGDRIRIAISGWFHLPQLGEPGYVEGMAEQLAQESSLAQLQRADAFVDLPQPSPVSYAVEVRSELSETDLEFLVKFISPQYLTPEAVAAAAEEFEMDSDLQLPCFLNKKTATRWGEWITSQPAELPQDMSDNRMWMTAGPPHKRRHLFQMPPFLQSGPERQDTSPGPWADLASLLQSSAFRTYLTILTGLTPTSVDCLLRRFRRGYDYQLAQNYTADDPRLELTLGLTPEKKQRLEGQWWTPPDEEDEDEDGAEDKGEMEELDAVNGKTKVNRPESVDSNNDADHEGKAEFGGEEIYMANDNVEDESDESDEEAISSSGNGASSQRSAVLPSTRTIHSGGADPAIYRTRGQKSNGEGSSEETADEDDEAVLQSHAPVWNTLTLVLRDRNTLRAVRYMLRHGPLDRVDAVADITVDWTGDEGEE